MCDHSPNREAAMVVIREGIWCDPCLEPLVRALNDGGLQTIASCCGHGHRPGTVILADGRWLVLATDNEARRIDAIFPVDVNGSDTSVNPAHPGSQGSAKLASDSAPSGRKDLPHAHE